MFTHQHRSWTQHFTDLLHSPQTMQFSAEFPLLTVVHSPQLAICHPLWIAVTRLSISCYAMALFSAYCTPRTFVAVLVSPWYIPHESSIRFSVPEGSSIPAALTSEASRVATLLGAVALCYNNYIKNCGQLHPYFIPLFICTIIIFFKMFFIHCNFRTYVQALYVKLGRWYWGRNIGRGCLKQGVEENIWG